MLTRHRFLLVLMVVVVLIGSSGCWRGSGGEVIICKPRPGMKLLTELSREEGRCVYTPSSEAPVVSQTPVIRRAVTPTPAPPTPTATPTPTPTSTPVPPAASPEPPFCPSIEEAERAIGASIQRLGGEACAFVRHADNLARMRCPAGWACTLATPEGIVLVVGDGQEVGAYAGTFRYVPAYPPEDAVHDPPRLCRKELRFLRRDYPDATMKLLSQTGEVIPCE